MHVTAAVLTLLAFAVMGYARPSPAYSTFYLLILYILYTDCMMLSLGNLAENPAPEDSDVTNVGDIY